jgi:hypothetical protein
MLHYAQLSKKAIEITKAKLSSDPAVQQRALVILLNLHQTKKSPEDHQGFAMIDLGFLAMIAVSCKYEKDYTIPESISLKIGSKLEKYAVQILLHSDPEKTLAFVAGLK